MNIFQAISATGTDVSVILFSNLTRRVVLLMDSEGFPGPTVILSVVVTESYVFTRLNSLCISRLKMTFIFKTWWFYRPVVLVYFGAVLVALVLQKIIDHV